MLQVKNITKQFKTGELVQQALCGVSLNLRDNEFVSILGPSGSGKTTLLNIIGGLDRYDSGDLIINGISTKEYKDRDWDSYRNHTIGFVFQSYNLIPHQSILANVELALTIAGLSRSERRSRAKKALEEVGLGDQLHKKPNQMSGGQMQRVAIARALVNNPDILLADEPTGALDTETSIQVMELLKKVAKNKLVVMVTHNPELAEQYSTRIVKLKDGRIMDDSNPYTPEKALSHTEHKNMGKAKMSFLTSLSLSFNNLRTKKGRTILTSFAGSIGIIGIALILALSSGVNTYIDDIQRETMTSYPITISAQAVDMSGMMGVRNRMLNEAEQEVTDKNSSLVYADYSAIELSETMANSIKENNLTAFKKYIDNPESEIRQYLGDNGVIYTYGVNFKVYSYDAQGKLISSDADTAKVSASSFSGSQSQAAGGPMANMNRMNAMMNGGSYGAENFSELLPGNNGAIVSPIITDSYELLYGAWPQAYDEAVLILNENNSVSADALYQLGLITGDEYKEITAQIKDGKEAKKRAWNYADICNHNFYMLPACEHYEKNQDGTFSYVGDDSVKIEPKLENGVQLKITGVLRPVKDAANANITTAVAYTSLLTDYIIEQTNKSEIVLAQEKDETTNVLNGIKFEALNNEAKATAAKEYLSGLGVSDKAAFYAMVMYYNAQNSSVEQGAPQLSGGNGQMNGMRPDAGQMDETAMAAALDAWLAQSPDEELLLTAYDEYVDGSTYEDNMKSFGKVSYDAPASISIYADSFEDKDAISECIKNYNSGAEEKNQITYTDYVALLTGSITTIVDVISYVLIAFVAVSLIVSSIMIGIITHISVLERTKEIGILRAMGASKRNISQVFNAETIIIGLFAGILGVGVTALLTIPINSILQNLLGAATLSAALPLSAALLLVVLSMAITVIAGLIPAKKAAKKDPVTALRTE